MSSQSVRNNKPPAMRVRDRCYTKKSPFRSIIELFKLNNTNRKVILWQTKRTACLIQNGCVNITLCLLQNTGEKIIYNQYRNSIGNILRQLCSYRGFEILEGHLMPDHVHMLVSIPPKLSVSQFMGYLKGKSALMMFDKHANLKYKFGNRHFWSEGYYVSTVGLNEATIRKYIQEQERHDIALDKLSVKEYENPFKDCK